MAAKTTYVKCNYYPILKLYLQARQTNTTVVVSQQPTSVVYQQDVPAWVGSDLIIYFSIFTMLCCGLLPGIVALMLAWEVRKCYTKINV